MGKNSLVWKKALLLLIGTHRILMHVCNLFGAIKIGSTFGGMCWASDKNILLKIIRIFQNLWRNSSIIDWRISNSHKDHETFGIHIMQGHIALVNANQRWYWYKIPTQQHTHNYAHLSYLEALYQDQDHHQYHHYQLHWYHHDNHYLTCTIINKENLRVCSMNTESWLDTP